ncbi:MAG: Fe-S cluster assembly ATPase SufC [Candidatus Thorarchaeota archaeon]|nr:Fe-S cluster assembly ATPase SufC [Candidatus Thorarchaeota archaeon]
MIMMTAPPLMEIIGLRVEVKGMPILRGVDLSFEQGKVYAILGPNASGKSTLAKAIMGLPEYEIKGGDIRFGGQSILDKTITERAQLGIAYAFQAPPTISGVTLEDFICRICPEYVSRTPDGHLMAESCPCRKDLYGDFDRLGISNLASRDLNDGFSGGEMKRSELFQVLSMRPKIMFLDEPDSGLDYDSLKIVGRELKAIKDEKKSTMVIISHHRYILEFLEVDQVYILQQGRLAYTGDMSIIPQLEEKGYEQFLEQIPA